MVHSPILTGGWFGKALLGTLAFALSEPLQLVTPLGNLLLLLLAVSLGHQWDVYARDRFSPTRTCASARQLLRAARGKDPWAVFVFCGMGRLASTDGAVQPAHIQLAEEMMARLGYEQDMRHLARGWFNAGAVPSCPLSELAFLCAEAAAPDVEVLALESFGRCAAIRDTPGTRHALQGLGSLLQFQQPTAELCAETDELLAAAELLEIEPGETSAAIKLAYRRGVARYHPDRLPADATDAQRALSQHRMTAFRAAYERLLAAADSR